MDNVKDPPFEKRPLTEEGERAMSAYRSTIKMFPDITKDEVLYGEECFHYYLGRSPRERVPRNSVAAGAAFAYLLMVVVESPHSQREVAETQNLSEASLRRAYKIIYATITSWRMLVWIPPRPRWFFKERHDIVNVKAEEESPK